MKAFFEDIFEYHHHFNQKLADLCIEQSHKIPDHIIPLFSHNINAHQIWNSRILKTKALGVHKVHTLEKCKQLDQENYQDTLNILSQFELSAIISYRTSKGKEFNNTMQQILFHVANHTTHHRGQIIWELRQNGIEPIVTDYIFYKR